MITHERSNIHVAHTCQHPNALEACLKLAKNY